MILINNNRSGRKNCDRVVGRLPAHIDADQRVIVVKTSGTGPTELATRKTAELAGPVHAPQNTMVVGIQTPESGPPIMNRAARRREEAKKRQG